MGVHRDDVGAEEDAALPFLEEGEDLRARVPGDLAHDPLGCGGVEVEVVAACEEPVEEVEVFGPAAHVGDDPGLGVLGAEFLEGGVLLGLAAVALRVGVLGFEPGVGVGDVGHEHHAEVGGEFHLLAARGAVEAEERGVADLVAVVDAAGRAPELDDFGAELAVPSFDVFEVAVGVSALAVIAHEVGDGDEADGVAEVLDDDGGFVEAAHRPGGGDAVEVAGFAVDGGGAVAVDVGVGVEDGRGRRAHAVGFLAVVEAKAVRGGGFGGAAGRSGEWEGGGALRRVVAAHA